MDSKRLKAKITVSVQLQRAINDTRRWIRVLSSETISHLKKSNKCIWFINTNACLALFHDARPRLHVIPNYVERVTLDVAGSTESVFTSWTCKYEVKRHLQKRELQLNEFTRYNNDVGQFWTWRRRWDEAYVKRDRFNVITYYVKRASQNRARWEFVFIQHIQFFFFLFMTDRFAR